jgi:putative endonuclease
MKRPCGYILASRPLGTLYVGVTSDLHKRMAEHAQGLIQGFTRKYGVKQLVYYEYHESMPEAIQRERQLKDWQRIWKIRLIEAMNPEWHNLFDPLSGEIHFGSADVESAEQILSVSGLRPSPE